MSAVLQLQGNYTPVIVWAIRAHPAFLCCVFNLYFTCKCFTEIPNMFLQGCPDVYLGLAVSVTLEESVDFRSLPLIRFGSNYRDMLGNKDNNNQREDVLSFITFDSRRQHILEEMVYFILLYFIQRHHLNIFAGSTIKAFRTTGSHLVFMYA